MSRLRRTVGPSCVVSLDGRAGVAVQTLEPDVVEVGDDLGVDLLQHFEAVLPTRRPEGLDAGVQAPGRAAWRRSYGRPRTGDFCSSDQADRAGELPDAPVRRGTDDPAVDGAKEPAVRRDAEPADVLAKQDDQLGRDGRHTGLRGGRSP